MDLKEGEVWVYMPDADLEEGEVWVYALNVDLEEGEAWVYMEAHPVHSCWLS